MRMELDSVLGGSLAGRDPLNRVYEVLHLGAEEIALADVCTDNGVRKHIVALGVENER